MGLTPVQQRSDVAPSHCMSVCVTFHPTADLADIEFVGKDFKKVQHHFFRFGETNSVCLRKEDKHSVLTLKL